MMEIKVSCSSSQERGDVTEILLTLYRLGYQCKVKPPKGHDQYKRVYISAVK